MALCRRISYLYALALLTVYALFLPLGGYERMMEGKYRAFLLLAGLRPRDDGARRVEGCPAGASRCALPRSPISRSPRSARHSPLRHGGAARRHAPGRTSDRRALHCRLSAPRGTCGPTAGCSMPRRPPLRCAGFVLVQLTGRKSPLALPRGAELLRRRRRLPGFYAGAAGNIDFTAFLLALCAAAMAAALVRGLVQMAARAARADDVDALAAARRRRAARARGHGGARAAAAVPATSAGDVGADASAHRGGVRPYLVLSRRRRHALRAAPAAARRRRSDLRLVAAPDLALPPAAHRGAPAARRRLRDAVPARRPAVLLAARRRPPTSPSRARTTNTSASSSIRARWRCSRSSRCLRSRFGARTAMRKATAARSRARRCSATR